jgi:hypothetical protein
MTDETFTINVPVKYTKIDDKLIKDGKMALLITSSYHVRIDENRFNPTLIEMILQNSSDETIEKYVNDMTHTSLYILNKNFARKVQVVWIPVGTLFRIERCADDGEFIVTVQDDVWNMA